MSDSQQPLLDIRQVPMFSDNYGYLLRDPRSDAVAVVDPGEAAPLLDEAGRLGWRITDILITHHHHDHVGGIAEIKAATGARVTGPTQEKSAIPELDKAVDGGDETDFGSLKAKVLFVPGHTIGHIAYWFEAAGALFSGDSLFALGCGRIFEGTPEMMWRGLSQYRDLPPETQVYCAHEYTLANARFALTVDPDNATLVKRAKEIENLRQEGKPTVPSSLGDELATNPFLRPDDGKIRAVLHMEGASDVEVFAEIRRRKDAF